MARNVEKAQSMLFRFHTSQAASGGYLSLTQQRRPKAVTTVDSIPAAEKWRGQVLKEISRKVSKIQEDALSDYQIRELNDEINKLMREKWVWERRIRDLGGPNYMRGGGAVYDDQGREVPGGGKGYRYFGRARELPGVKEMFEQAAERAREEREAREGGGKMNELKGKIVDAGYYGWNRDEEDGTLLAHEARKEWEARNELLRQVSRNDEPDDMNGWEELPGDSGDGVVWNVPSADEVEQELLARRKHKMLERFGGLGE